MCKLFECKTTANHLADHYGATWMGRSEQPVHLQPGVSTTCLLSDELGTRQLRMAQFGIAPPNSKSPLHPTFDHSLASIEEVTKWPWLDAIEISRCIVPISAFHICSYWGDPEGTEIYFYHADEALLHAAGIYRVWNSTDNSERRHTMSLLTRPASDYVVDHGSDRQPIFVAPAGIDTWICNEGMTDDNAIEVLRQHSVDPPMGHRYHRDMPAGWRKHQKQMTRRRGQTMAAQDRCPHACGF